MIWFVTFIFEWLYLESFTVWKLKSNSNYPLTTHIFRRICVSCLKEIDEFESKLLPSTHKTIEMIFHPLYFIQKLAQTLTKISTKCVESVWIFDESLPLFFWCMCVVYVMLSAMHTKTIRTAINNMKCHSHKFHLSKNFLSYMSLLFAFTQRIWHHCAQPPHLYSVYIKSEPVSIHFDMPLRERECDNCYQTDNKKRIKHFKTINLIKMQIKCFGKWFFSHSLSISLSLQFLN